MVKTSLELSLVSPSNSVKVHSRTNENCILDQCSDMFTGLGCAEGEYTIQLDESLHSYSTEAKVRHLKI